METITKFFTSLGFRLHNSRWSWGAHTDLGVLLRTWRHDLDKSGCFVRVWEGGQDGSLGAKERLSHLRTLWPGGLAGYAVFATAQNPKAQPRTIESYDSEKVYPIVKLSTRSDGSIWAELGEHISVNQLERHAAQHRLFPGKGASPPSKVFTPSSAIYIAQLPHMRKRLIDVAQRRETITYAQACTSFQIRSFTLRHVMDRIGHACLDAGEPILTSLIVNTTGRCSNGFTETFQRNDDEERRNCYEFWASHGSVNANPTSDSVSVPDSLRESAARFSRVAVRPDQAAFRRRIFIAYGGACVVTGCKVREALDAAHRIGRDWRCGHNDAADGLLLRKDIHALYDAGRVQIAEDGSATFDSDIKDYYARDLRKA